MNVAQKGYFQELCMLSTYQKAKSEENNKHDLNLRSYDLSNLFQQYIIDQQSNDSYIQNKGLPFHVYMYTEEQINILDKNINDHIYTQRSNCNLIYIETQSGSSHQPFTSKA